MRSLLLSLIVAASACAGDDGGVDLGDYDARCVTACTDTPPAIAGAGDVCDSGSQRTCLDACTARIMDVSSVCASCLLEDACFNPGGCGPGGGDDEPCEVNSCTITGRNGSCSYPPNDNAARESCERQVNPRREVACTVEFEPVSACASSCQM
jgi:hypothetical protein